MKFDLIVFDCDGVLIDSEMLANRSEVEFLKSLGIEFDLSDYMARFVGKNTRDVLAGIESLHGVKLSETFWKSVEANTFKVFQTELKPIAGIFELLASTDRAKCVASSSSLDSRTERLRQRLDLTLQVTGLFNRFSPHIFSAEQVNRGKPAPDLFLFAADRLQVHPGRCIVVEDSLAGVRAGVAAGMTVLGFTGRRAESP